jgi:hypothetical protein
LTAARRCGPRELVGYENVESTQPITIGVLSERTGVGMFETAAEVLGGLNKAFNDDEKKNEPAWRR